MNIYSDFYFLKKNKTKGKEKKRKKNYIDYIFSITNYKIFEKKNIRVMRENGFFFNCLYLSENFMLNTLYKIGEKNILSIQLMSNYCS